MTVTQLPVIDLLPSNTVQRIFQDREGYLWFGTLDGLCRYDGYRIISFRSDRNKPDLLTNNEITCLADNSNHLWIGTKQGLNILDKKTCRIHHFHDEAIQKLEIKSITVASDNSIWTGAGNEIFRYNPDFSLRDHYNNLAGQEGMPINSIYEDRDGEIWILTWKGGLFRYDAAGNSFIPYPAIGTDNNPFQMFQDDRKQRWIGTWGNGLYLFSPGKETPYTPVGTDESVPFYSIVQDNDNKYIWAMSYWGLRAFEYTDSGAIRNVDVSGLFRETNNLFSEIIKDRDGNLWIGAFSEGAFTVSFNRPVIRNYSLEEIKHKIGINPSITSVYEDKDGTVWLNLNRYGLCFIDPETGRIRLHTEFPELERMGGTFNYVTCMTDFRDSEEVWIAKESAPSVVSLTKNKRRFTVSDRISRLMEQLPHYASALFVWEDSGKNRWIASRLGVMIKPFGKDTLYSVGNEIRNITGITGDSDGNIWVGSASSGLYKIAPSPNNPRPVRMTNYSKATGHLKTNNIQTVCGDADGNVWLGTKDGSIITCNIRSEKFDDLSKSCAVTGEAILNILIDDYRNVWISTHKKIIEYNPVNRAVTHYTPSDGLSVRSFLKDACYKSKSGKLFFGGNRGLCSFTASERLSNPAGPGRVIITNIRIQNASVFDREANVRFNSSENSLVLEPADKNIEIEFSTLNYAASSKIRYAYKIDGIDRDWIYAGNNRQFASYSQLEKGHHLFRVKATDENGLWNEDETVLNIYRKPALYETGWAYSAYAILILLTVFAVRKFNLNRVKPDNEVQSVRIDKSDVEINISTLKYPLPNETFLEKSVQVIEQHLDETEFGVNALAKNLCMSQSTCFRKIKALTGRSPVEFIRNIRLKHACRMLKDKSSSISDIAYSVGFSDPKYFTACFKDEFGMTPTEYQRNNR
jgi:ligand-binding sensor domain-containing protein/AraC-like DNA-binding protein